MPDFDPLSPRSNAPETRVNLLEGAAKSDRRLFWALAVFLVAALCFWAVMLATQNQGPVEIEKYLPDPSKVEPMPAIEPQPLPETPLPEPAPLGAEPEGESALPSFPEPQPSVYMPPPVSYSDLPEVLRGEISESDWAYLEPAIVKAIAAGERSRFIPWENPAGLNGTVFQSGTGEDGQGCRQVRVTIGGSEKRLYVEKCANGQYR